MFKRFVLVSLIVSLCALLFSFEWGVKYGAGVSATYGKDTAYNLLYNLTTVTNDTIFTDAGYVGLKSNHRKGGITQNAGLFFTIPLAKGINELQVQPEVIWQRYNHGSRFRDLYVQTDNGAMAGLFFQPVKGTITSTLDYISIPFLIKMQQAKPAQQDENEAIISSYGYVGPSVSFLMSNSTHMKDDIKDIDDTIKQFVKDTQNDFITNQYYTYKKYENAIDKVAKKKYDIVFGFGWNLQNVLKLSSRMDEMFFDARFNLNVTDLGDADKANGYKLLSGIISIGYKL